MTYKKIRKPWFYSVATLIALNSQVVGDAAGSCYPITFMLCFNIFAVIYMTANMFSDMKFEAKIEEVELTQKIKDRAHYLLQVSVVSCFTVGFVFCGEAYFLFATFCSMIIGILVGFLLNYNMDYGLYQKSSTEK